LLEQRLAGALRDPAMCLAVYDQRVDGAADIVDGGVADDLDAPSLRVDVRVANMKPMREAGDLARDLADVGERPTQLLGETRVVPRRRCDSEQVERAVGTGDGEMPVGESDVGFGRFEPMRRPLSMMSPEAWCAAMLARHSERPECEPAPIATRSVSPVTSRTQSGRTASHSPSSCAKLGPSPSAI
jgi:hypothetical protein